VDWNRIKKAGLLAAAATIIVSAVPAAPGSVSAAASNSTQQTVSIKPVYITKKSYIALKDAQLMLGEKGNILTYTISVFNNDANDIEFLDYWTKVKSKSGKTYITQVISQHKNINVIPSKSSQNITFYALVDTSAKLSDLIIDVLKWDFSAPNFERKLGAFQFPANYSMIVPLFKDKVVLLNNTKLRTAVKQTLVSKDQDYYYVDIQFMIENVGFRSTTLDPLIFYVESDDKSIYPVQTDALKEVSLQPKERRVFTLKATIPIKASIKKWKLITSVKEETDQIDLPLAIYYMPQGKTASVTVTPVNETKPFTWDGQSLEAKIAGAFMIKSDKNQQVYVDLQLKNTGSEAIEMPDFEYLLQTKNELYMPMSAPPKEEKEQILPKETKTVSLKLSANTSVDFNEGILLIRSRKTETSAGYLLASMSLPKLNGSDIPVGKEQQYGAYKIKVNGFYRLPWDNDDIISADITITNTSEQAVKIPNLTGSFLVDGVPLDAEATKTVKVDQAVTIAPQQSANLTVYSKIPYTTEIHTLKFLLNEQVSDTNSRVIGQFVQAGTNPVPSVKADSAIEFGNTGARSEIKVMNAKIYEGKSSKLFYADLALTNKERRNNPVPRISPYVRLNGNQDLPITISEYKERIMPNGTVLLSVWGPIPKSLETEKAELILSQSVTGDKLTGGEETPDAAIKPVLVSLDISETAPQESLESIRFNGYTLSMRKLYTHLNVTSGFTIDGIKLNMEYDLERETEYDAVAEAHKLVIEFVDQDQAKAAYTKEFALGEGEEGEEVLKLGLQQPKSIVFEDPEVTNKVQSYTNYRINIYDQFQNHRVLLASKLLRWFTIE
jgi:hypothetical protein